MSRNGKKLWSSVPSDAWGDTNIKLAAIVHKYSPKCHLSIGMSSNHLLFDRFLEHYGIIMKYIGG